MGGYMDNYSVLLVDDEEEVIHVIMRKINWEGLGFSVAGHANNGAKALEMVEEFHQGRISCHKNPVFYRIR